MVISVISNFRVMSSRKTGLFSWQEYGILVHQTCFFRNGDGYEKKTSASKICHPRWEYGNYMGIIWELWNQSVQSSQFCSYQLQMTPGGLDAWEETRPWRTWATPMTRSRRRQMFGESHKNWVDQSACLRKVLKNAYQIYIYIIWYTVSSMNMLM